MPHTLKKAQKFATFEETERDKDFLKNEKKAV